MWIRIDVHHFAHVSKRNTRMRFGFTSLVLYFFLLALLPPCQMFAFCCCVLPILSYFSEKFVARLSIPSSIWHASLCGFSIAEYCDLVCSTRRKRKMKVVDGSTIRTHRSARKYETTKMIIISWYGLLLAKIAWRRTTKLEFFFPFFFQSFRSQYSTNTQTHIHEKFKRFKCIRLYCFLFLCGYYLYRWTWN